MTPVTVKEFASENEVHYLYEHQTEFPGMQIADTFVRQYPYGDLAAQLMGYVGEISETQLKQLRGYALGDKIGQGGIESAFDSALRGQTGLKQLRVDSLGRPTSPIEVKENPSPGYAIRLTLDAKLQRASQQAVIDGINLRPGEPATGTRRRARSSHSTRVTARSARSRPTRPTTRTSSRPARRASSRRCSTRAPPRRRTSRR